MGYQPQSPKRSEMISKVCLDDPTSYKYIAPLWDMACIEPCLALRDPFAASLKDMLSVHLSNHCLSKLKILRDSIFLWDSKFLYKTNNILRLSSQENMLKIRHITMRKTHNFSGYLEGLGWHIIQLYRWLYITWHIPLHIPLNPLLFQYSISANVYNIYIYMYILYKYIHV